MDWGQIIGEVLRRGWTLTVGPAYFMERIGGSKIELYEFDPDGDAVASCEIVRCKDDGLACPIEVREAAIKLCRKLDPGFGK